MKDQKNPRILSIEVLVVEYDGILKDPHAMVYEIVPT